MLLSQDITSHPNQESTNNDSVTFVNINVRSAHENCSNSIESKKLSQKTKAANELPVLLDAESQIILKDINLTIKKVNVYYILYYM